MNIKYTVKRGSAIVVAMLFTTCNAHTTQLPSGELNQTSIARINDPEPFGRNNTDCLGSNSDSFACKFPAGFVMIGLACILVLLYVKQSTILLMITKLKECANQRFNPVAEEARLIV